MTMLKKLGSALLALLALAGIASAQKWTTVNKMPNIRRWRNGAAHRWDGAHPRREREHRHLG